MLAVAVHDEHPAKRYLRLLGADLVFRMPVLSELARKCGSTLACNPDAERLMRQRRAGRRLPGGLQGRRQAVRRPVQVAAVRPGWLRVGGAADRYADRAGVDRRRRGDLPDAGQREAAGPAVRAALLPGDADVPVARAAGHGPAAQQVADRVRQADRDQPPAATTPTTRWSCSTWPTRCARRSSSPCTSCSNAAPTRSPDRELAR